MNKKGDFIMSSTNKTANYQLSQYIGTDKPTYLGDYNGDMLKIDTQMKKNADAASTASSNAGTALSKANDVESDLSNTKTTVQNNTEDISEIKGYISELKTNVQTAQQTANTASSAAAQANGTLSKNVWTPFTACTNINSKLRTTSRPFGVQYNEFMECLKFSGSLAGTLASFSDGERLFTLPSNVPRPTSTRFVAQLLFAAQGSGATIDYLISVNINQSGDVLISGNWNNIQEISSQYMIVTSGWFD